jgi:hypothetical protein
VDAAALADAAGAAANLDIQGWLLAQGPVGVLAGAIGYGWRKEHERADAEVRRADAERAATQALIDRIITDVVPALTESTRATEDLLDWARTQRRPGP